MFCKTTKISRYLSRCILWHVNKTRIFLCLYNIEKIKNYIRGWRCLGLGCGWAAAGFSCGLEAADGLDAGGAVGAVAGGAAGAVAGGAVAWTGFSTSGSLGFNTKWFSNDQ